MKIDISKYLKDKYKQPGGPNVFPGPVVTISRELGCPSKMLAQILTDKLNLHTNYDKKIPWRYISKEILEESARELGVDNAEIQYVFEYKQHGPLEDLLLSYSRKFYKTDRKIRNTISRVIRNFAEEGNSIIIGRGGVAITRDIPKSFHVHLEAPLNWRALRTSEKHNMNIEEAKKYCIEIDKKRAQFRDYFEGKGTDYTRFDVKFNCMTLGQDEIADIIISCMKVRNLI
ncbi:MAG: cytidylate kinase-like family protein [Bacteroidales bacterium]|nr:cytidylate kinase-like family protein [Bacteroidales bacterium]MCF8389627.1 cytidylate kinase-like family protein [Bacteroidales bacterium]